MKKTIITSAFAALLLSVASCTSENDIQVTSPAAGSGEEAVITLTGDITEITRTVLDGDPTHNGVKFTSGDAIGVWDGFGTWKKFTVSELSDEGCTAKFTGMAKVAGPYYILYTYSAYAGATFDSGNITVGVPAAQGATPSSSPERLQRVKAPRNGTMPPSTTACSPTG